MQPKKKYMLESIGYSLTALLGILGIILGYLKGNLLLMASAILIVGVSADNLLCGDRVRKAGRKCKGHYCIPKI